MILVSTGTGADAYRSAVRSPEHLDMAGYIEDNRSPSASVAGLRAGGLPRIGKKKGNGSLLG